jgi:NAD(P)-dependent dehydrogenase (short-subunit alcohol dehydrogenase family)
VTDEDIDWMMAVNVKSARARSKCCRISRRARRRHIINVRRCSAARPSPFRSAYSGAKTHLNALTAMRTEVQATHPNIQFSIVSPGVASTRFCGNHAVHGGPDSRTLQASQPPEEVAAVIAGVITSRRPDVYTRAGSQAQVTGYLSTIGEDP